ncbi:muconolactone Delta-isomerase family protein [Paraburkholderia sp. UCT31]
MSTHADSRYNDIISGLPLVPYISIKVTALRRHPSSRRWRNKHGRIA